MVSFGVLLRGWRDRLDPADAGLPRSSRRRARGLRREELAQLAGLSVEYVLRLEQGRATNPSAQVVAAITRALQLTRGERDQLYRAAGLLPPQDSVVDDHVPPGIQRLCARLGDVPIGVFTADWTLVWWNNMWTALHGDPSTLPGRERNLARILFGTGEGHAALRPMRSSAGWESFKAAIVADLRDVVARYPADARLAALISALRQTSASFDRLWRTVQTATLTGDEKTITHPIVGEITVDCDVLTVPGADLRIVTYTTATGGENDAKLDRLRSTVVTASPPDGESAGGGHPAIGATAQSPR